MLAKGAVLIASLAGSLVVAELGARAVRKDAFPFLNLFVADARYGVVLAKNAATRLRSRTGRINDVRTNAQGFRGPDFDEVPAGRRVLLLGDSQVFGYGVDEKDAMAAQLADVTGGRWHGMAGAIPTWGPLESTYAARDLIPIYRPSYVAFFANVGNDWTEANIPNNRRTTSRDGWSSRLLAGVHEHADFPFRAWFMGRSHLVHAVRTAAHAASERRIPPAEPVLRALSDVDELTRSRPPYRSRLTRHLLDVRETCVPSRCTVLLVVLPRDVQVHPSEWRKYRIAPRDTSAFDRLVDPLVDDARDHGVRVVDLRPALAGASPGAFLHDDDHLAPRGHRAVAAAIHAALSTTLAAGAP